MTAMIELWDIFGENSEKSLNYEKIRKNSGQEQKKWLR